MSSHVFICYSRADRVIALRLVEDLVRSGVQAGFDKEDRIPGSPDWDAKMRAAIQESVTVLLLASPSSKQSPYVNDELAIAQESGKPIHVAWIGGQQWEDSIPAGFTKLQPIDARDSAYDMAILQIAELLTGEKPVETRKQHKRDYILGKELGTGGFGSVYRAHQPTLNRDVAIKVIKPEYASQPQFIQTFDFEAKLVARLEHPHIVPLYDYWRDDDGAHIVMRLISGGTLRDQIQKGKIEPYTAARYLDQISLALAAAHRSGIVHRDLKPENILMDEEGNCYLADFGIAKPIGHQTTKGEVSGTIAYMSPETLAGEPPTPASDIYSLGIMVYEMLEGKHPFEAASLTQMILKHMNEMLPELTDVPAHMISSLRNLLIQATAKNPKNRTQHATDISTEFRAALQLPLPEPIDIAFARPAPDQSDLIQQQLDLLYQQMEKLVDRVDSKPGTELRQQINQVQVQIDYRNIGLEAVRRNLPLNLPLILSPPAPPQYELVPVDAFDQVKQSLLEDQPVVLLGAAGVGKSELASKLAHDTAIQNHFETRVVWFPMGKEPDLFFLLGEWLLAFGIAEDENAKLTTLEMRRKRLYELIGTQPVLVIVDNLWKVEHLRTSLMDNRVPLVYLVTTRLAEVSADLLWDSITLNALSMDSRKQLLGNLIGAEHVNSPEMEKLLERFGGMPGDLVLLGKRLRQARNIATRLRREIEKLIDSPAEVLQHGFASLHISVESLSAESRQLFRILAIFPAEPNTISEEAIEIIGGSIDYAYELIDYSLLKYEDERYTLHPGFAEYARQQLQLEGDTLRQVVNYYAGFVKRVERHKLAVERRNIETALNLAYEHKLYTEFVTMVIQLIPFWEAQGMVETARKHLDQALSVAQSSEDRAQIAFGLAISNHSFGDLEQADQFALTTINEANYTPDDREMVKLRIKAISRRGYIKEEQGYIEEGLTLVKEALDIALSTGNSDMLGNLYLTLGTVAVIAENNPLQAKTYYQQALSSSRSVRNDTLTCTILQNMALLEIQHFRQFDAARQYITEGLELARKMEHVESIGLALSNRGALEMALGQLFQARLSYEESLQKARLSNNSEAIGWGLLTLANVLASLKEFKRAETHLQESVVHARQRKNPYMMTPILDVLRKTGELRIISNQTEFDETVYIDVLEGAQLLDVEADKCEALQDVVRRMKAPMSDVNAAQALSHYHLALIEGRDFFEPVQALKHLNECLRLATDNVLRTDALLETAETNLILGEFPTSEAKLAEAMNSMSPDQIKKAAEILQKLIPDYTPTPDLLQKTIDLITPLDPDIAAALREIPSQN